MLGVGESISPSRDANCSFLLFPALSRSPDFPVCLSWPLTFVLEALLKCLVSLAVLCIEEWRLHCRPPSWVTGHGFPVPFLHSGGDRHSMKIFLSWPVSPDNVLWVVKAGHAVLRVQLGEGTWTPHPSHSDLICFRQVSVLLPSAELSSLSKELSPPARKVKAAQTCSHVFHRHLPPQSWALPVRDHADHAASQSFCQHCCRLPPAPSPCP